MNAASRIWARLRRTAVVVVGLGLGVGLLVAPVSSAKAVPPSASAFTTNDAILKWINGYRHRPDPEQLPSVVRALSAMQAFKAAESSGAYIGFVAGVLGSNVSHAEDLIAKMLSIDPADHWVLVRAIAYSGLPNWRELLATFVDRMATRRAMIDKYLDGKLPRLEQIDFQTDKPGILDKIKSTLHFGKEQKKAVALQPAPELIDVLWGYYLATGSYVPIQRMIKLLPLANDKDNVDSLTTGSAAKFTLASNAVRDSDLLAMLKWADKSQPKDVKVVLDDVIETAETVDTVHMRQESLAAIEELKSKGPNSKRELSGWGQIGQGALSMGCVVAAATGQIELGIPCVIGGAAYTAGLQYVTH
ncbi:MAG TPA: hypothetical protein VGZ89_14985 [Xanthobacteraceae bacterium]|jgi:hypothetical protein|nr:hypothetical protein [Xanthobacteraceae bacterium]